MAYDNNELKKQLNKYGVTTTHEKYQNNSNSSQTLSQKYLCQLVDLIKLNENLLAVINKELWSTEEFVLSIISVSNKSLAYVDSTLWKDVEFIKKALELNINVIECIPNDVYFLHENEFCDIERETYDKFYKGIKEKNERIIDNKVAALAVLNSWENCHLLKNVSDRLKNDQDVIFVSLSAAIRLDENWTPECNLNVLEYFNKELWKNKDFVLRVLRIFDSVKYEILEKYREEISTDIRALYFNE